MKKLLSIISVLCCVLVACHLKTKNTTGSTGNSNSIGVTKDTSKTNNETKAVIHGSQNQAQLDSIKSAKTKAKK